VGPVVVAGGSELVRQLLQPGDAGGAGRAGRRAIFHGLLKSLRFALGLGVVRLAVLLPDARAAQLVLEAVAAASAAGQPGSDDHAVACHSRGGRAVGGYGGLEGREYDRAGDPVARGDRQRVPAVVIEPGQDLGTGPVRERVAREVSLPALAGLLGLEPDAGRPRALARLGGDQAAPGEVPADGCRGHQGLVVVLQVPGDRHRAGIQALAGEFLAEPHDQACHLRADRPR
jgi:hypothetical protein